MGTEIQGKTLGIVGLGRIGREVARRAAAFGMKVVAFDPFVSLEQAQNLGVALADLKTVLSAADVVTLHAPSSDKTKRLINAETLSWMRPEARLINCARGDLIDEAALAEALRCGRLAGAALDVFDKEPLAGDSPLRALENVILTPHLGASTHEAQSKVALELSRGVLDYFDRGIAANALNLPGFDPATLESLGELLDLAERLGRFLGQVIESGMREFSCVFSGDFAPSERRPLAVSALKGCLSTILASPVNAVNARALAAERGIRLGEANDPLPSGGYRKLLTVSAATDQGAASVSGALIAPGEPRIVRFNGLSVEVNPRGKMIVLTNQDRPGMIGRVGTLMGRSGINIADMRVGRLSPHGQAVMVLTVDQEVGREVRGELEKLDGVANVRWVKL